MPIDVKYLLLALFAVLAFSAAPDSAPFVSALPPPPMPAPTRRTPPPTVAAATAQGFRLYLPEVTNGH
jgi:hypothetical protein